VDKHAYLLKKRSREESNFGREDCLKCFRPLSHCLCPHIRPFQTRTRFIILMHPKEARKTRNGTGRLAHLALRNSEVVTGIDFSENHRIQSLLKEKTFQPFILYPGKTSKDISEFTAENLRRSGKQPLVFAIDGTWTAAKKMMKMSQNLHLLPRISIQPETPSRFVIKHQPNNQCLSTIEALCILLTEMERMGIEKLQGRHNTLIDTLERMVKTQLSYIENVSIGGYRRERDRQSISRQPSKKQRRLFPFFR
jgi:DTW domain-containing protein YfiP